MPAFCQLVESVDDRLESFAGHARRLELLRPVARERLTAVAGVPCVLDDVRKDLRTTPLWLPRAPFAPLSVSAIAPGLRSARTKLASHLDLLNRALVCRRALGEV